MILRSFPLAPHGFYSTYTERIEAHGIYSCGNERTLVSRPFVVFH